MILPVDRLYRIPLTIKISPGTLKVPGFFKLFSGGSYEPQDFDLYHFSFWTRGK